MNSKKRKYRLIFLCICFFAMIGVLFAVEKSAKEAEAEKETETESYRLVGISPSDVTEISMIRKEEESYNLKKEGEIWNCLEDSLLKLDSEAISAFLEDMSALVSDTKIEAVSDFEQYGLSEPYINLTLQSDNNMYVIKTGNYNSVISAYYVQINDEPVVYTITSTQYEQIGKALEDLELVETEAQDEATE